MPVLVKLRQNFNRHNENAYGKYYGKIVSTKTMTYKELTKHMSEHNSVYGEDVCSGVAIKLQNCILEQLLEGKKVQFGDLGTFYLAAKSKGVEVESDFNIGTDITGLFLRFSPNRQDINDLSSKTLKKRAKMMNINDLITTKQKEPSTVEVTPDIHVTPDTHNGDVMEVSQP